MSRFQQVFTALRWGIPDSAWHRLQTHSESSTCPKLRCPRCWRGSENSGNSSVISIPQLRRCATCPSEQRRNPKSSSRRKRRTLRVYLTGRSIKEHFQRVLVCIAYILRIKISSTWLESLERFAQKRTIGCSPRCAAMKKAKRRMQTSFSCPVKSRAVLGMSDVFQISGDLTGAQSWCCKPHSGRFSFPRTSVKNRRRF